MGVPKAASGRNQKKGSKLSPLNKLKKLVLGQEKSASPQKTDSKSAKLKAHPSASPAPGAGQGGGKKTPPPEFKKPASAVTSKKAEPWAAATAPKAPAKKEARQPGAKASSAGKRVGSSRAQSHHLSAESVCREVACEGLSTTGGYCRMHYIKNWKKIKRKELILREKKLNQYIEELVIKYPDKYIEAIRQDLASDKDFAKVIYDLDLDEGIDDFDVDGDSMDSLVDNIKRDFEDEGEGF